MTPRARHSDAWFRVLAAFGSCREGFALIERSGFSPMVNNLYPIYFDNWSCFPNMASRIGAALIGPGSSFFSVHSLRACRHIRRSKRSHTDCRYAVPRFRESVISRLRALACRDPLGRASHVYSGRVLARAGRSAVKQRPQLGEPAALQNNSIGDREAIAKLAIERTP
jgi:hypothetical protein